MNSIVVTIWFVFLVIADFKILEFTYKVLIHPHINKSCKLKIVIYAIFILIAIQWAYLEFTPDIQIR